VVEGLERTRESVEKGCSAIECVGEGVDGSDKEVEGKTPIGENCIY